MTHLKDCEFSMTNLTLISRTQEPLESSTKVKPLTLQQIRALFLNLVQVHAHGKDSWDIALVRAVEKAHGIGATKK